MKQFLSWTLIFIFGLAETQGQTPPTPTNLVAQIVSSPGTMPRVRLTWQSSPGQWSFRVYRSEDDSSDFDRRGSSNSTSYEDHDVNLSRTYFYYVTSVVRESTLFVESPRSNIAHIAVTSSGPHGSISGIVQADANNQPIANVAIVVCRLSGGQHSMPPAHTNLSGQYEVDVDTGWYIVKAEPPWGSPYRSEYFDNVPDPSGATPVRVTNNSNAAANFGLASSPPEVLVHIQGTVKNVDGVPLPGASVTLMRTMQEMSFLAATTGQIPGLGDEERIIPGLGYARGVVWSGQTNQFGQYYAHVFAGASYLAVAAKVGYMPLYFDNKFDPTEANIIGAAHDTSGIDFSLPRYPADQNSVRGTARDSTGETVPSRVILFPKPPGTQPPQNTQFVHSDSLGNYEFSHVREGVYGVLAVPYSNFAPAFYKAGEYGVMHWQESDSIVVGGSFTDINIGILPVLSPGLTHITGTVTGLGGNIIIGGRVFARTSDGYIVGYGVSDGAGDYSMDAVPAGEITMYSDRNGYSAAQNTISIPPSTYTYNSNFVLGNNVSTGIRVPSELPYSFELQQSYPNPFNPTTTIQYSLPIRERAVLKVFNVLGREVATLVDAIQEPGVNTVGFDASGLSSGLYFYRLEAGKFVAVKRALLLK